MTMLNNIDSLNYHCETVPESAKIIDNRPKQNTTAPAPEIKDDNREAFYGNWKSVSWSE